jgi:hypothetical protein
LPLWIEWGAEHPSDSLPPSGVTIESVQIGRAVPRLVGRLADAALAGDASAPFGATLGSSRGRVVLAAPPPAPLSA